MQWWSLQTFSFKLFIKHFDWMLLLIMRHVLAQSRFLWDCLMVSNTQTHTLTHLLILFIKIIQFQTIHCIENSLFQLPIPNYSSSLHFNLVNSLSQLLFNTIYYIKQVTYNVPVEVGKGWKKLRKFYTKFDVKNRLIICCAKQVYFFLNKPITPYLSIFIF